MADKDTGGDEPSLELPALFGKKKREAPAATTPPPAPTDQGTEATTVLPAVPPTPAATHQPATTSHEERPTQAVAASPAPADAEPSKSPREPRQIPSLAASTAAVVVGAVAGLLGVALTFGGLKGCELVTGTDSCGGPGLLVLFVIVVAMVLVGAALLKLFRVPDAGSVSFLGVGIMAVVVLIFLVSFLDRPVMLVVIPALTALSYAIARWVTTQLVEDVLRD